MTKILEYIKLHRFKSALYLVLLVGVSFYGYRYFFPTVTPTTYVVTSAQKGTIIKTVSGTGQISATNQVDIKPKASGDIIRVTAVNGQAVKAGQIIAYIDATDALKSVRDAEVNLKTSELSYEKLKKPADTLSLLQAQNSIASLQDSISKTEDDLNKSYEDAFNTLSNAFLSMPTVINDLNELLYGYKIGETERSIGNSQTNEFALVNSLTASEDVDHIMFLRDRARLDYKTARDKFDSSFNTFKNLSRASSPEQVLALLNDTNQTLSAFSEAAKSEAALYDAWIDIRTQKEQSIFSQVNTYKSMINSDISTINNSSSNIFNALSGIKSDKQSLESYKRSLEEKQQSFSDLQAGADPLDLQSSELSLQQRRNAVADARANLANYTIRAPFDGVLAKVSVQKGDSVSAGTAAATMITNQQTVEISLNEVDLSKVKVGQKVNLTFDAVADLNITGAVADIDAIGTVSQGVVTYNVKISLDTQDERVKPGMSVSASIITDIKQDVLMVQSSAIKGSGEDQYVEMPNTAVDASQLNQNSGIMLDGVKRQVVTIGISNDTQTEIVSGLNENDQYISRTISSAKTTTQQGSSILQQVGGNNRTGNSSFGGATRALTR